MPRFHRHKLLLDEGLPYRIRFPRLNSRHDLKHVEGDLKKSGLSDEKVYEIAERTNRLLIIFNIKDFKDLAIKSKKTGIIGVSQNLSIEEIDKKLTSLVYKKSPKHFYEKLTLVPGKSGKRS